MGNIGWRSQASSEDTDSSLQGDLDEDTGKYKETSTSPDTSNLAFNNSAKHSVFLILSHSDNGPALLSKLIMGKQGCCH